MGQEFHFSQQVIDSYRISKVEIYTKENAKKLTLTITDLTQNNDLITDHEVSISGTARLPLIELSESMLISFRNNGKDPVECFREKGETTSFTSGANRVYFSDWIPDNKHDFAIKIYLEKGK